MTTLDLTALAALAPQAADLAIRVESGDLVAAFDAQIFLERVDKLVADARAFVARTCDTRVPATRDDDDLVRKMALEAADDLDRLIGFITGAWELQAALDDARSDDDPDNN